MRKALISIALIVVLGAAVAGGFYWYMQGTPRQALMQMVVAIQTDNPEMFFQYIDLPSIIGQLTSQGSEDFNIFGDQPPGSQAQEDDVTRLVRSLGKKVTQVLVPKVVGVLEPQIKEQVGKYLKGLGLKEKVALTGILTQAQISQRGDLADVTLEDQHSGEKLSFQMAKDPESRKWRIVAINYQDFKRYVQRVFK